MPKEITPVIQTFLDIVQIDSPTGHEEAMSKYIYDRLISYGLKPTIDKEDNVHARFTGESTLEPIFINAHLDTVEPGVGVNPHIDDEGFVRSDRTTVLGADNKSSVAATLEAVKKLIDTKVSHRSLDLLFTVSEEGDSHGAISFDYSLLKSTNGISFDISDEDVGTIFVSAPFYNRLTISLQGQGGHAKSPEKAKNVLPVFVTAMNGLPLGRYSSDTVVNIGSIHGGQAANAIPGQLDLIGEVRSSVEAQLEEVTDLYRQSFANASLNTGVKVNFVATRENPGFKIDPNHPFLLEILSLLAKFGLKPQIKDSMGCADANFFAGHGLTTINIADGTLGAHTIDERIHVDNLNRLVDLIVFLSTN